MKRIEDISVEFRKWKIPGSFDDPFSCSLSEEVNFSASPLQEGSLIWCRNAIRNVALAKHHSRVVNPDFLSIRFVESGSEYLLYEGEYILIEPGDITLLKPGRDYVFHTGPEGVCIKYNITAKGTALEDILKKSHLSETVCFSLSDRRIYLDSFEKLVRHFHSEAVPRRGANAALCLELLENLADEIRSDLLPGRMQEIILFIERNLENSPTPEKVSRTFGLCPSALNRLFRKHLHTSSHRYINGRKMELASRLLREESLSVKETSGRVGFATQFSFSREFKKYFGLSPKKFSLAE